MKSERERREIKLKKRFVKRIENLILDIEFDISDGVSPPLGNLGHLYTLIGLSREFNETADYCRIDSDKYMKTADRLNDRLEYALC